MLKDAISRMADVFLPNVLMHGRTYQQKGFVLTIRLSDGLLKARVKGSSSNIYDVHVDLKTWPNMPARCSCPYHVNCKHAAASLFAMQVKENLGINTPVGKQSLSVWLDTLKAQEQANIEQNLSHEIAYLIEFLDDYEHRVAIKLALAKRLKRGGLGKKVIFNTVTPSRKQYFSAEDEEIIATLLFKCDNRGWFDRLIIRNSELLQKIIQTNRAWLLKQSSEERLSMLESLTPSLHWYLDYQGQQQLSLTAENKPLSPFFLDKTWYIDESANGVGLLESTYSPTELKLILSVPPIGLDDAEEVAAALKSSHPHIPSPQVFHERIKSVNSPEPVLCLNAVPVTSGFSTDDYLFLASFYFIYQDVRINPDDVNQAIFIEKDQKIIEIPRDFAAEKAWQKEARQILPMRHPSVQDKFRLLEHLAAGQEVLIHYHQEDDLIKLYQHVIPVLKSKGWHIEFLHPIFEEIIQEEEVEWYSELKESNHDFFSYTLGILIDGKPVNIVPLVVELISQLNKQELETIPDDKKVKLTLPNNKRLALAIGRIKPLIRFILQYGNRIITSENTLQITRYQILLMEETEQAIKAAAKRWQGGEKLRQQLQQLVNQDNFPHADCPINLNAALRDYQRQGLNWLQFLRHTQFGGILADDMGLGKTIQTLSHLQLEKEQGRLKQASLIIAPTSLVGNWLAETQRFTPQLNVLVFHGSSRHNDNFDDYDLVVSTYGLIQRDKARFVDYPFYYLILDEAQFIKNARAKTTQIIQQIKAQHRLCLSGTPLENNLNELWSLFHFLMPGLLGDAKQFRQFFKNPIEKQGDLERRELLAKRVKPFMLRRTKNQVAKELPPKTEIIHTIDLVDSQRDLYEAIRMTMEKKVRDIIARQGMGKSHIVLLDALLKLRQVCCDPRLLSIPEAKMAHGNSAKLDALMTLLDNLLAEGRRVLVFSQFTSMLGLIEEQLQIKQYAYLKLTGQTTNRQNLVQQFQEGEIPLFLISLKAGGTGLNLTRADTVIHYDPWWNPAAEDQASDRAHRIGQENPVFVYKLITSGTVEEAILSMQNKKRLLVDGILNEQAGNMIGLTAQDVEQFFVPLSSG